MNKASSQKLPSTGANSTTATDTLTIKTWTLIRTSEHDYGYIRTTAHAAHVNAQWYCHTTYKGRMVIKTTENAHDSYPSSISLARNYASFSKLRVALVAHCSFDIMFRVYP